MSYYAEFSPYGHATLSEGDCLYRFKTKYERDCFLANNDWYKWCSAKVEDVRHRYRMRDFEDKDRYEFSEDGIRYIHTTWRG